MDAIDNAIATRGLVRITARNGRQSLVGVVGIALGYNAQYHTVKVGFIDEGGQYTGESTVIGFDHVEVVDAPVQDAPKTGAWFVEQAHTTATPRFGPKWFTEAGPFKTERQGEAWLADNAHRLPSNRYWRVVLDTDD